MFELNNTLTITERKGLHFRAMLTFNEICKLHDVEVVLNKEGTDKQASSSNTMGILLLGIAKGDSVIFCIKGTSQDAVESANRDFSAKFAS
jgi:phosphotransferase system HPr (HPr) family protein